MANGDKKVPLTGTTLRVYRYLYRTSKPAGIRDIQRALGLSSPSVAEYHVKKLLAMGLVKEWDDSSFFVDRLVFENMIRIKQSLIPVQFGFVVYFASGLILLLTLFRPVDLDGTYLFSIIILALACAFFSFQAIRAVVKNKI